MRESTNGEEEPAVEPEFFASSLSGHSPRWVLCLLHFQGQNCSSFWAPHSLNFLATSTLTIWGSLFCSWLG